MIHALLALALACTGPDAATPAPVPAQAAAAEPEPPSNPPTEQQPDQPQPDQPQPDTCLTDADCGAEQLCEGMGCDEDSPGACVDRNRVCTKDLRPYCGCDGQTFLASGSCPGARYQAAMPCPGDPPSNTPPSPAKGETVEIPGLD